jgi:hypothetical protein
MNTFQEKPTLHFFRSTPVGMAENPPLASSLQSLETTFLLLSLERYPSALISCVSAWESAIKAKLRIPPEDHEYPLAKSLGKIRQSMPNLMQFDRTLIDGVRKTRNRIVHYGFSPHDDQECGRLLLETGLPFLVALYRELFGFHLNWHDVRPGITDFMQLTKEEAIHVGLVPYLADQLFIVTMMYKLNKGREDFDLLHCFTAFNHFLRVMLRDCRSSNVDVLIVEQATSTGIRHELEEAEKKSVARQLGGSTWEFDCPICNGTQSIIAGLDESALEAGKPSLTWAICVACHLVLPVKATHLANLVLSRELRGQTQAILEDVG